MQQVQGRGVFSFCMCPGGVIAPAATNPGELVVNGWSPSKRNNPFANSGMVVQVSVEDAIKSMTDSKWQMADDGLNFDTTINQPPTANSQPSNVKRQRLICPGKKNPLMAWFTAI